MLAVMPVKSGLRSYGGLHSLKQLVNLRGFYAHAHSASRPNAVTIVSPQMASNYVDDVLKYMNNVAAKAMNMSFYVW